VKYREINELHKQMLRTSAKVAAMPAGSRRDQAVDHLHRGQSNDCYWHGLFGGIYISHMRLATYEHLIAAEDLADAALGTARAAERLDLDMDGRDEVRLAEPGQVVTVKPGDGAGISGWDLRAARHAVGAVMRRRPEAYHATLRAHEAALAAGAAVGDAAEHPEEGVSGDAGVTSIHDIVMVKEAGLADRLHYDDHERRSGLLRFLAPASTPEQVANGVAVELGDFLAEEWQVDHLALGQVSLSRNGFARGQPLSVSKTVRLDGGRLDPALILELEVHHRGDEPVETRLGLELAIHLLGGGGNPSAWYDVRGDRAGHDSTGEASGLEAIGYGNDWVGVAIEARPEPAADAWWSPIETVSNSEAGFERVYQGSGLLVSWPVTLAPGESRRFALTQRAQVTRDQAAPDGARR
jgi:4-alpha-glucanotransferase